MCAHSPLVAGGFARTLSCFTTAPIEFVRTRAQGMQHGGDGLVALVRRAGLQTLWRGASASMARDVPFSMCYWGLYEAMCARLVGDERTPTPTQSMLASGAAAALAAVPTTPLDVAKSRLQAATSLDAQPPAFSAVLRSLYRQRGVAGLFSGVGVRVAKVAPSCAIIVGAFELGKARLGRHTETV